MIERLEHTEAKMDWIRTCVLFEPRGSMDSFGAIVLPPIDKRTKFSIIFMNTLGYVYMCGHATIGVAGALSKLGYIRMEGPETEISYEAVAGIVNVRLHVKDSVIGKISVVEPPSFFVKNVSIELAGVGEVPVAIAFGGNFFAIVDSRELGIRVEMKNIRRLIELGLKIRDEVNGLEETIHPENPYIKGVDLAMIYEEWGFSEIFPLPEETSKNRKKDISTGDIAKILTFYRCLDPGSYRSAVDWFKTTACDLIIGIDGAHFNESRIYRELTVIEQQKEKIEQ
ncbi:MAG: proline racemase family protein, partial [Euryarchaeota archaeon]|nr:proline racemase family protein [Euryarchaeota archaeon]